MKHHPPISTLFPYTTLFRSSLRRGIGTHHHRDLCAPEYSGTHALCVFHGKLAQAESRNRFSDAAFAAIPASEKDRKSTRLNSSHPSISYAVFCLKKKKKNTS